MGTPIRYHWLGKYRLKVENLLGWFFVSFVEIIFPVILSSSITFCTSFFFFSMTTSQCTTTRKKSVTNHNTHKRVSGFLEFFSTHSLGHSSITNKIGFKSHNVLIIKSDFVIIVDILRQNYAISDYTAHFAFLSPHNKKFQISWNWVFSTMFVYKAEHGSAWSRFVNIHLTLRLICFDLVGGRFKNLDCGVKEKQMVWFDVIFSCNFFSNQILCLPIRKRKIQLQKWKMNKQIRFKSFSGEN